MFRSQKAEKPKRDRSGRNLAQYGLFDPASMNLDGGADDGDSDLEAELSNLVGGTTPKPKGPPPKKAIPDAELDAMVAESMKDIPSDAELSGDDDDPSLLSELNEIAGVSEDPAAQPQSSPVESNDITRLLSERLKMYEVAEKNAKDAGETSRARRFNRGVKTLQDLLRQAKASRAINNDDIPPEVSVGPRKPAEAADGNSTPQVQPSRPAPSIPSPVPSEPVVSAPSSPEPTPPPRSPQPEPPAEPEASSSKPAVNQELVMLLNDRRNQYRVAALKAKKSGDAATAISYIKIAKQFETVIAAAESGQPVDLSNMPTPPVDAGAEHKTEENIVQSDNVPEPAPSGGAMGEDTLITASSVGEALEQRLEIYKKQEEAAKEQGNSSKMRRMGRIVKQYEQAIKLHKAGKPIPADELPTPPGYAPIPGTVSAASPPIAPPRPAPPAPAPRPPSTSSASSEGTSSEKPKTSPTSHPSSSHTTRITGNQMPNSRADKQMALLLAKQKEFKEAALKAKRKGEIEQAKEFLRTAKGFEPLIEAASCGLPVDLSTLPVSPTAKSQLEDEYDIVMSEDVNETKSEDMDVISRLEAQLTKQLKMCLSTRDHHKALGDVQGTNRFERLALTVTKDLDLVRLAHRTRGAGVPKFHYETRDFSVVKSFTELNDNDLELTIMRGISYACSNPKDVDTYVKFEFPFPQEAPFQDRTVVVKDTNSPDYNATFTIPIQRTARACQRVFKRHSIKFEVYSKGGFFRGDSLIGTVNVKLQPLETQCELHESFDLHEGRKKVGGKLEVRLRLRHPIVSQEVEQLHEKWLVIDN